MKTQLDKVKAWLGGRQAEIVIRLLVIASIIANIYMGGRVIKAQQDADRATDCLQNYIVAQRKSDITARTAAAEDRQVVDNMVSAITHAHTREDTAKALNDYLDARRRNDELRAKNPPVPFSC